jgi:hypothetical protein
VVEPLHLLLLALVDDIMRVLPQRRKGAREQRVLDPKDCGERARSMGEVHAHDDLVAVDDLGDEKLAAVRR